MISHIFDTMSIMQESGKDRISYLDRKNRLASLLVRMRLAHDTETANYILGGFSVAAFMTSLIIFYNVVVPESPPKASLLPPIAKTEIQMLIKSEFPSISDQSFERLPEHFYLEDISLDIIKALPGEIIKLIPQKPR